MRRPGGGVRVALYASVAERLLDYSMKGEATNDDDKGKLGGGFMACLARQYKSQILQIPGCFLKRRAETRLQQAPQALVT